MKRIILLVLLFFDAIISMQSQTWQWAKGCDGAPGSNGISMSVDSTGNAFVTGVYSGTLTAGAFTLNCPYFNQETYLIKYDPNGNVLWAKTSASYGQNNNAVPYSICNDASGNAYLAGVFTDSIAVFGTFTLTNSSAVSTYLVKYDPNGNVLWAKNCFVNGPNGGGIAYSVSHDANNSIFIAGAFNSSTIVFGTYTLTNNTGNFREFLVKYDLNGYVIWANSSVGQIINPGEYGVSVSADINGNAFITGTFESPTITFGTYTLTNAGSWNMFLTKYDANGNVLWAKSIPGNKHDMANCISTDVSGNAYLTGVYASSPIVFGTYTLTATDSTYFLAKFDANGNALWVKNSIGIGIGRSISVYSNGVLVAGSMRQNLYTPLTLGTYTLNAPPNSSDPAFIAQYDINGNVLYAEALASGGDDWITISADKFCDAYLFGDYIPNPYVIGTSTLTHAGPGGLFLAKLSFANSCQSPENIHSFSDPNFEIKIYPNPFQDGIFIQSDSEISISVYDIYGRVLYRNSGNKNFKVETATWDKGIYQVMIQANRQTISRKFVKE